MPSDRSCYQLPVCYRVFPFIGPRAHARRRLTGKRGNKVVTGNSTWHGRNGSADHGGHPAGSHQHGTVAMVRASTPRWGE